MMKRDAENAQHQASQAGRRRFDPGLPLQNSTTYKSNKRPKAVGIPPFYERFGHQLATTLATIVPVGYRAILTLKALPGTIDRSKEITLSATHTSKARRADIVPLLRGNGQPATRKSREND